MTGWFRYSVSVISASAAFVVALASIAGAQSVSSTHSQSSGDSESIAAKNCGIRNFGQISSQYYRGAQPEGSDYKALADLGVKTVIDLERDGDPREEAEVKAAGMNFFRLEMSDRSTPTSEEVNKFLSLVSDPSNLPVFVHCHGGKHRTGAMTAVYRMTHDGWDAERAFEEMKSYNFTHGFGHGSLKNFVFDYYSRLEQQKSAADSSPGRQSGEAASNNK